MEIIVNKKQYKMLKQLDSLAYLDYLELRDYLSKKDDEKVPYTKSDFIRMAESIVAMYGKGFTVDELLASVPPETIMVRFASFDYDVAKNVNNKAQKMQANFTKHK